MRQENSVVVRTFLAAAALAVCVWAGSCPAQAAPGSIFGAQPSPQNAWVEDGVAQLPGDADSPSPAAKLREQALAAMEALREEIATLTALRDAQAALLAWNRGSPWNRGMPWDRETAWYPESTKSGASLQALSAGLCSDPAIGVWCPLLPATFGASHVRSDGDTPSDGNNPSGGDTPSGGHTEDGHDRN